MNINKQTFIEEAKKLLETLFSLPEVEKIAIKEVVIASLEDEENINKGIDLCYHDRMSDMDLSIVVRINSIDYYGDMPLYHNYLSRLQFGNNFLGMSFSTRFNLGMHEEHLRICLKSGFRMDLVCCIYCDDTVAPLPSEDRRIKVSHKKEGNLWEDWSLEQAERFWFTAVHNLSKLIRKDYLIADHLSHMLLMESLVIQMQERDNIYQTTIHRYGYEDNIAYLDVDLQEAGQFMEHEDEIYNMIAKQLYRAVVTYDKLVQKSNPTYESNVNTFIEIWRAYIG